MPGWTDIRDNEPAKGIAVRLKTEHGLDYGVLMFKHTFATVKYGGVILAWKPMTLRQRQQMIESGYGPYLNLE